MYILLPLPSDIFIFFVKQIITLGVGRNYSVPTVAHLSKLVVPWTQRPADIFFHTYFLFEAFLPVISFFFFFPPIYNSLQIADDFTSPRPFLFLCSASYPYSSTKYMELYKYSTCDLKDFEGPNIQNPNGAREPKENSSSLTLPVSHLSSWTKAVQFGKASDVQH